MAAPTLPSKGPKRKRKCHATAPLCGVRNKKEQNQKWLPHPCLVGGAKDGGNAILPLHSRGLSTKRKVIKNGYLTPTLSRVQKKAKILHPSCILGGPDKKKQNQKLLPQLCLLGVEKIVEMLYHPCIGGVAERTRTKSNWLPHRCLLGGPKEGKIAT